MRFGHISAASRPRAVFYSTNRIYSASLTRLHARPASETLGYYRNHKLRYITGATRHGLALCLAQATSPFHAEPEPPLKEGPRLVASLSLLLMDP